MPWLCSDHEKKNTKTKEVYGKTKDVFECFSLLLECCSCCLCALDQNKVKAFFFLKDSFSSRSVFYTGSCKARFFNQPDGALFLSFMIIVNAVITPITQQKKGKQFWVNFFLASTIAFLKKCFINPWPFPSLVATQISWQLLKPAWTCPCTLPKYGVLWVLIWTHPFEHPRQNSDAVPVCSHVFCVFVWTGALPATLPTRRNWSSVFTVTYRVLKVWTHLCQDSGNIVLGLLVCSKMRLTTPCRCLTKKKKLVFCIKDAKQIIKRLTWLVLSSNYKPMNQMLRHQIIFQGPVVGKKDSVIRWINLYPVDSAIGFPNTYLLYSDLSSR